nr:MAG TPA: hypothetical protein [Caudoviricetes sp.]
MGKLFRVGDTLKMLDNAVSGLGIKVFPTSRPKSVPESMNEFVVVSLPVSVLNMTYGTVAHYGLTRTTCRIEVFVRDKAGVENVSLLDHMVDEIVSSFPITRDGICVSNPTVVMEGADGYGFHVVAIQATVQTI